jgi:Ran GTPase-activating protein (RanGAP) involved in mRNA processing and transport
VRALVEALRGRPALQTLALREVGAGPGAARSLSELLSTNASLLALVLDGNDLGNSGARPAAREVWPV